MFLDFFGERGDYNDAIEFLLEIPDKITQDMMTSDLKFSIFRYT